MKETRISHFLKFIRRTRKRMIVLRWLERTGLAIAVAALASMLLIAFLQWRGRAIGYATEAILALGLVAGTIWGFFRPATMLQAALRVDEQANSAELFSTAWLALNGKVGADASWRQVVIATAQEQSQPGRAPAIVVHRLGTQTWAMIGLAVCSALTLSSLCQPRLGRQNESRTLASLSHSQPGDVRRPSPYGLDLLSSAENRPVLLSEPEDLQSSSLGQSSAPPSAKPQQVDSQDLHREGSKSNYDSEAGGGHGSTRTAASSASDNATEQPIQRAGPTPDSSQDAPAAGTGVGGRTHTLSDFHSGMTASAMPSSPSPPPPWNTLEWPQEVQNAQRALSGGAVPADYRDLVREYFSPNAISTPLPD